MKVIRSSTHMKQIRKLPVRAASEGKNDEVQDIKDIISALEDDFDYLTAGLEKLSRMGANATNAAKAKAGNISKDLQIRISEIADLLTNRGEE